MNRISFYGSTNNLGGKISGVPIVSHQNFIDYDDCYSLQIIDTNSVYSPTSNIYPVSYTVYHDALLGKLQLEITYYPGDTALGNWISCSVGEEKTLSIGSNQVKVKRLIEGINGSITFHRNIVQNTLLSGPDLVNATSSGYLCKCIYARANVSCTLTHVYIEGGNTGARIGDTFTITTDTDEHDDPTTIPTGMSLVSSIAPAYELQPGDCFPIWIFLKNNTTLGEEIIYLRLRTGINSTIQNTYLLGSRLRRSTSAPKYKYVISPYEFYQSTTWDHAVAQNVSLSGTFSTLPHEINLSTLINNTIAVYGKATIDFGIRAMADTGATSQNQLLSNRLCFDSTGELIEKPNSPTYMLTIRTGGYASLVIDLDQSDTPIKASSIRAELNGETRRIHLEEPGESVFGIELNFRNPLDWGMNYTVNVYSVTEDGVDSEPTSWPFYSYFVYQENEGNYTLSTASETSAYPQHNPIIESFEGEDINVKYEMGGGYARIKMDDSTVLFDARISGFYNECTSTISPALGSILPGEYDEAIEWNGDSGFYLCAGGERVAYYDISSNILTAPMIILNSPLLNDCPYDIPIYETTYINFFQLFDLVENRYRPWMGVDCRNGGMLHFYHDVQFATPIIYSFNAITEGPFSVEVFPQIGTVEWTWNGSPMFTFDINNRLWYLHDYHIHARPLGSLGSSTTLDGFEVIEGTPDFVYIVANNTKLIAINVTNKIIYTGMIDTNAFDSLHIPLVVYVPPENEACYWQGRESINDQMIITYFKVLGEIVKEIAPDDPQSFLNINNFKIIQGEPPQ